MWVGMKGILGKLAGETDKGMATLRTQNGEMISNSKGKRAVLAEHNRKPRTLTTNKSTRRTGSLALKVRSSWHIFALRNKRVEDNLIVDCHGIWLERVHANASHFWMLSTHNEGTPSDGWLWDTHTPTASCSAASSFDCQSTWSVDSWRKPTAEQLTLFVHLCMGM